MSNMVKYRAALWLFISSLLLYFTISDILSPYELKTKLLRFQGKLGKNFVFGPMEPSNFGHLWIEFLQPSWLDTFARIESCFTCTYFTRNFSFNHVLGLEGNHYSTFLFTREQQWFHLLCQLVTFQWHLSSGFSWIWHQAQCDFQNSIVSITHFRATLQQIKTLEYIKLDYFKNQCFSSSFLLTWCRNTGPKWPWGSPG
jgi:hypothetical protein